MSIAATALLMFLSQDTRTVPKLAEPAARSISWQIDLKFVEPRRIEVQTPGDSQPQVYWYLVYTATNTSSTTQQFFPIFQLVTDDLHMFETDMGVNHLVFDAIKERHRATHPLLIDPTRAIGPLSVGDDNARESVAIWRNVDLGKTNQFKIFVTGLSGETKLIRNPGFKAAGAAGSTPASAAASSDAAGVNNSKYFTLRKTLEITFSLPGSDEAREQTDPKRVGMRWIMR